MCMRRGCEGLSKRHVKTLRCVHQSSVCLVSFYGAVFWGCVSVMSVCAGSIILCVCACVRLSAGKRANMHAAVFEGASKVAAADCAQLHAQLLLRQPVFPRGQFSGQDSHAWPTFQFQQGTRVATSAPADR